MANKKGIAVGFGTRDQMNEFIEKLNEDAVYVTTKCDAGYVRLCRYYYDIEEDEGWLDYSDQYLCMYGEYALTYLQKQTLKEKLRKSAKYAKSDC